jgi:hypothetical protein
MATETLALRKCEEARTALGEIQNPALSKWGNTPSGWDPYEVWRTRILLPRLAEDNRVLRHTAAVKGWETVAPQSNNIKLGTPHAPSHASGQGLWHDTIEVIHLCVVAGLADVFLSQIRTARGWHVQAERTKSNEKSSPCE